MLLISSVLSRKERGESKRGLISIFDSVYLSVALLSVVISGGNPAYDFQCGFTIDGMLVHYGIPKYDAVWAGRAWKDRIVIDPRLSDEDKVMVFAHERFHWQRMNNGSWDNNDKTNEEILAYEYASDKKNWDYSFLRFKCAS